MDIDRLDIIISAEASKAEKQLNKLLASLEKLSGVLGGLNTSGLNGLSNSVHKLSIAMQGMNAVKTTDFTRLAKNIQKLAGIDTKSLNNAASSMSVIGKALSGLGTASANAQAIGEMAKNLSKLGNKGIQNAITNMPQLADALKKMMQTLQSAPRVSNNLIRMTEAMGKLASNGNRVGSASRSLNNGLRSYGSSADTATRKTKSLASAIGMLYAKYWAFLRAFKALFGGIEKSMDFSETVNYFEVAMRKIGEDASKNWEGNGYDSAEAYAESFAKRSKELTEKMTGFRIDSDGNAVLTNQKSLGLDPDKVLQYQAQYAQMADSIGMTEEAALNTSKALTMLGTDWASLRNISFDQAWEKFASALAGQSRAVRSLGIDITQATLQEYAYKYGLETAVSEMNQATKAQLRLLAILDQSKVAFGDLANTMQSPANQLRLLQQNFSNLARIIGNIFLPIVAKVLPYINGVVIALQRLFQWIGNLLGIKLTNINTSMGGMSDSIGDLIDSGDDGLGGIADNAGNASDALNNANDSAKKLKRTILGFDELNVLNDNSDDSGSKYNPGSGGIGGLGDTGLLDNAIADALADYEKAWNEAFDRMENKAVELADKITAAFKKLRDIIVEIAGYFKKGFFNGIGDITPQIENIVSSLKKIKQHISDIWSDSRVRKTLNDFVKSFFETLGEITGSITRIGTTIAQNLVGGYEKYLSQNKKRIKDFLVRTFDASKEICDNIGRLAVDIADVFSDVFGSEKAQQLTANLIKIFSEAYAQIIDLSIGSTNIVLDKIVEAFENNKDRITNALSGTISGFESITSSIGTAMEFVTDTVIPNLLSALQGLLDTIKPLTDFLFDAFYSVWTEWINPALEYIGETVIPLLSDTFQNLWNNVLVPLEQFVEDVFGPAFQVLGDLLGWLWNNIVIPLGQAFGGVLGTAFEDVVKIINEIVIPAFSDIISVLSFLWHEIGEPLVSWFQETFGPSIQSSFESIGSLIEGFGEILQGILDFITGIFTSDWEKSWEGVKKVFHGVWNGITGFLEGLPSEMLRMGRNVAKGLIDGISEKIGDAIDIIREAAYGIIETVQDAFDTHSPSVVMYNIGQNVMQGLENGMDSKGDEAERTADGIGSRIKKSFDSSLDTVGKNLNARYKTLFEQGQQAGRNIESAFSSIHPKIPYIMIDWSSINFANLSFSIPRFKLTWFAKGGFPNAGELFMANEKGPEMIGKMGNRNVVANNKQITDGIKNAVVEGMMEVAMATSSGQSDNKPYILHAVLKTEDNEVLARAVEKGNMSKDWRYNPCPSY